MPLVPLLAKPSDIEGAGTAGSIFSGIAAAASASTSASGTIGWLKLRRTASTSGERWRWAVPMITAS